MQPAARWVIPKGASVDRVWGKCGRSGLTASFVLRQYKMSSTGLLRARGMDESNTEGFSVATLVVQNWSRPREETENTNARENGMVASRKP